MNAKIIDKKVKLDDILVFNGDANCEFINFEIPKTVSGISLCDLKVFIKTVNSLGGYSKVLLKSVEKGDNLQISWVLGAEATAVCGMLECQVVFENDDGTVILNTHPFYVSIEKSVSDYGEGVNCLPINFNKIQNIIKSQSQTIDDVSDQLTALNEFKQNFYDNIDEIIESHVAKSDIKSTSYEYSNLKNAISEICSYDGSVLKVGDVIRFHDFKCPHLWVFETSEECKTISDDTTVQELTDEILQNGYFQVGYYRLKLVVAYCPSALCDSSDLKLPLADSAQEGYVLTVDENGNWVAKKPSFSFEVYDGEYE